MVVAFHHCLRPLRDRASPYILKNISSIGQVRICIDAGLAILEVGGDLVDLSLATLVSASGLGREMSGCPLWAIAENPGTDVETMALQVSNVLKLHAIVISDP
jgi:hypothetical protein